MATTKGSCSVEEVRTPWEGFGVQDSLTGGPLHPPLHPGPAQMQQCLAAAQCAATTIFQFYRDSIRRRYSKS